MKKLAGLQDDFVTHGLSYEPHINAVLLGEDAKRNMRAASTLVTMAKKHEKLT